MDKFYVYLILDPRKPGAYVYGNYSFNYEPFYVGKGHGNRIKGTLKGTFNIPKAVKISSIRQASLEPIVIKIKENLLEDDSFGLEIKLIKLIGKNILTNLTDGGEGTSGYIPWNKGKKMKPRSEEHKRKLSESHKGKKFSKEHKRKLSESHKGQFIGFKHPNYGKKRSISEREKQSTTRKSKNLIPWNKGLKTGPQSKEHIIKATEARRKN